MNKEEVNSELIELLNLIKKKPGLYIGRKSIVRLKAFIDGFLYSMYVSNGKKEYFGFFPEFQDWVQERYNIDSTHSWGEVINFYSRDEAESLDNFFELFEEFYSKKYNLGNEKV